MICFTLGIVVGLIVGWNFLPQPQRVKDYIDQLRSKFTQ